HVPRPWPDGLALTPPLPRADVRGVLVGIAAAPSMDRPQGARVGSSSRRRQALPRRLRPDLDVVLFRGNVQTRLRKLDEGVADGTIFALAGLKRLGLAHLATDIMPVEDFPPAPGQGAICIESRVGDSETLRMVAAIHDVETGQALACERAFLAALDGSCRTPIAGHAIVAEGKLSFR